MNDVKIPFGEDMKEHAILLLAAAEELDGFDQYDVRTSIGAFVVDEKIAKKAGVDYDSDEDEPVVEQTVEEPEPKKAPAKKTAAKKTAKKTAAKKSTSTKSKE
jgi:hypothetical protein